MSERCMDEVKALDFQSQEEEYLANESVPVGEQRSSRWDQECPCSIPCHIRQSKDGEAAVLP